MSVSRSSALELASYGINVNAIAPGTIETPGTKMDMNADSTKQLLQMIPLKRIGQPEDIANAVLFWYQRDQTTSQGNAK